MKRTGMKVSLWTNYGANNSRPVFDAFAHGCLHHGIDVVYNDPSADVDVIWSVLFNGRMAPNKNIWEQQKPTIVLEVGGIKRGTTWKVGLNGINRAGDCLPSGNNNDRARLLGLKLKPWKINNEYGAIIIACQHAKSHQWRNQKTVQTWVFDSINLLRQYTNRKIIIRPHPRCPIPDIEYEFKNVVQQTPAHIPNTYDDFDFDPSNAYAVVNWSSNPATQAVIQGIPVFVGPDSLAFDVGNTNLACINAPRMPDRTQWLNDIAHTEWTVEEISQGIPHKHLTSKLI